MSVNDIPTNWVNAELREISIAINPGFPSGKHNQNGDGTLHMRPMNIDSSGQVNLAVQKFVAQTNQEPLKAGDVLFNNTNSPALLGKTAYIPNDTNWAFSNHMTRIRIATMQFESKYVAAYLHHLFYQGYYQANCQNHVNQASIGLRVLESLDIPVPPLNEQKRIVEKLEQLLSELDKAVDALKAAQQKLKTYRRAVLKAAVEGELSRAWREENKEGVEPFVTKLPDINGVESNTFELTQLPDKWSWVRLNQVADVLGGFAFKSSEYTDEGFQIVKIGNVGKEALKLEVKPSFIKNVDQKIVAKYLLNAGDVVISLTGTRFKRDYGHPIVVEQQGKLLLNQRVARLRFHPDLDSRYCQIALGSEQFQNQFFSYETGNVGQGNVGMNALRETYIPLPPLEEQTFVRNAVEAQNSVIENLQKTITDTHHKSKRLRQSILQKAFSGLLVPQDPNDEPASTLLERIRAEREAAQVQGKRGKKKTADDLQPRLLEVDA